MNERKVMYIGSALVFGGVFGGLALFETKNIFASLIVGIFSGVFFSFGIFLFFLVVQRFSIFGLSKITGWAADEIIVLSGDANFFNGGLAEGGKLFLTNKRIRFCGHRMGLSILDNTYQLTSIESASPFRTLGIVPNGMAVTLSDGRILKFVVYERDNWCAEINGISKMSPTF